MPESWSRRVARLFPAGGSDVFKRVVGLSQDELTNQGRAMYPGEDAASNHPGHRLAAKLMTERYGPIAAQLAGLANEGLEGVSQASMGVNPLRMDNIRESVRDVGANLRGSKDAIQAEMDRNPAAMFYLRGLLGR